MLNPGLATTVVCRDCVHSHTSEKKDLECRFFPPSVQAVVLPGKLAGTVVVNKLSLFPVVTETDSCSQGEPIMNFDFQTLGEV